MFLILRLHSHYNTLLRQVPMRLFAVARIVSALPCKTNLWTSWLIASKVSLRKSLLTHTQACRKQFLRLLSTIDDIRGLHVGSMYSASLFIVAANSCACVLSLSQQHLVGPQSMHGTHIQKCSSNIVWPKGLKSAPPSNITGCHLHARKSTGKH